jgi:transposase-like protein
VNATTRRQHPNAPLTPEGRRRMVRCVTDRGWTVEATADRFQVDAETVRKWRDRWLADGDDGLRDRSSRPHRSPNRSFITRIDDWRIRDPTPRHCCGATSMAT